LPVVGGPTPPPPSQTQPYDFDRCLSPLRIDTNAATNNQQKNQASAEYRIKVVVHKAFPRNLGNEKEREDAHSP